MMRHHAKLATFLSALAMLPLVRQDGDRVLLESAYSDIVGSLDVMHRIEAQVADDPEGARALLLDVTEPQAMPAAELDARLDELRREVSLLRMELDARQDEDGIVHPDPKVPPGLTVRAPRSGSRTAGLSDDLRNTLRTRLETTSPIEAPSGHASSGHAMEPAQAKPGLPAARNTRRLEPNGYSADPIGQARASFYAKRYGDALTLLEGRNDLQARYMRSRCLTQLDRFEEAIAILSDILVTNPESYEGRRAAVDIEFARWKQEFIGNLPKGMRRTGSGEGDQ